MLDLRPLKRASALAFLLALSLIVYTIMMDSFTAREYLAAEIYQKQFEVDVLWLNPRTVAYELDVKKPLMARADVYVLDLARIQDWTSNGILDPIRSSTNTTGASFTFDASRGLNGFLIYNPNDVTISVSAVMLSSGRESDLITISVAVMAVSIVVYIGVSFRTRGARHPSTDPG